MEHSALAAVAVLLGCSSPESSKRSVQATFGAAPEPATYSFAPTSTTLSIGPLTLVPRFSPAIHDYYVRCAAGTNELTVSMTAAPGSTIALLQPTTTPLSTDETATVSVTENEAIVIGVTANGTTDPYWVRCLPHDFPKLQMTLYPDAGTPTPGYYLVGNVLMAYGQQGYAIMLDGNGVPVWYHTTQTHRGASTVEDVVPGTISYVPNFTGTFGAASVQFELHDPGKGTTTYVESSGVPLDTHELRYLPNGDYLVFAAPITTGVDLTGLASFGPSENIVGCDIQEVDPTGAVVWRWTATDHLDPVKDTTWPQTATVDGQTVVEPFHCNSIDVSPDGDLLVSARHLDSVFLVSKATGTILWKMGGATFTKEGAPYIAVTNDPEISFYRQHDARFLPNGDISMFDDQTDKPGPARGVIYAYDVNAGTAVFQWEYQGTASSAAMGSFRILPDGSRVIGWGNGGATDRSFTEVGANGTDILDFGFPDGTASYRAIKVTTSAFEIDLLRATAGSN